MRTKGLDRICALRRVEGHEQVASLGGSPSATDPDATTEFPQDPLPAESRDPVSAARSDGGGRGDENLHTIRRAWILSAASPSDRSAQLILHEDSAREGKLSSRVPWIAAQPV